MLINNRYRFIFMHVPKTGGTTVHTVLHQLGGPADIDLGGVKELKGNLGNSRKSVVQNDLYKEEYGLHKHTKVRQARKILGESLFNSYFVFAFVRNPFSRTYSSFHYAKRFRVMDGALDRMTFSDYLRTDIFENLRIQGSQSQAEFLQPLDRMDMICRFERLEADLRRVLEVILRRNVARVELPHLNKSVATDGWRAMAEADKDIIRRVLARDFEELGYDPEDGSVCREFGDTFPPPA